VMLLSFYVFPCGRLKKAGDEQGFTLIELIVVTFLIGIMLSISIPSLRNTFFSDPLKTTTRKMIGLVTGVRELAARSQQSYMLHISDVENRIWYEREVEGETKEKDTLAEKDLRLPESIKIAGVWVGNDESLAQGHIGIWISKRGYMNNTTIRLEEDNGKHLNVQFYPFLDPAIVSDEIAPH
jgi:prepilin-type N-terminal cleavage/methylation domain-containing protein